MTDLIPYPLEDLRRDMRIKLATPEGRKIIKALGKDGSMTDYWRHELVAMLTANLQHARIERPPPAAMHSIKTGTPR